MNKSHKFVAKMLTAITLLSVPVSSSILAEEVERRSQISELQKSKFVQDLENRLSRDIKAYLNHEFFIIQVDAQLENVEKYEITEIMVPIPQPPVQQQAPITPQQNQSPQEQISVEELPVEPTETDIISQMELETDDGINQSFIQQTLGVDVPLPGIPLPPEVFSESKKLEERTRKNLEQLKKQQTKQPPDQPQPQQPLPQPAKPPEPQFKKEKQEKLLSKQEEIRQMRIKVLIDDHVSPEQETFIRNLVIEKANLSFIRGDEIRILRSKFPAADVLDPPEEEVVEEEQEPPEEEVTEPPVVEEPVPQEEIPWWQEYWLYLAIAAGLLLLLLLYLLLRKKNKPEIIEETPVLESETSRKVEELIDKMHQKVDTVNENRLDALKEELVSLSVTDQKMVGEQVKELLDSGNEESLIKSALLYKLLGEGLYKGLANKALTPEKQVALAAKTLELDESISADEKLEIAESVYQLLMQRRYQQQHNMQDEVRPFAFLEKLNDDQILFLLKDEDLKVKSLVMSQLSSDRGASLLKRFPEKGRSKVAIEISNFAKLPVAAFRDIANRLAKMAVHVPSFENLEVDGINLLTDMLDHMNSAEETSLLKGLRKDNPDLYYQIRQIYVSFDDIITIPKMGLKNLVRELERDDLALALFDVDDSFREAIYSVMLDKPKAMLKSTLEGIKNPEPDTVEDAKRKVSRKARAMLKSGVFKIPRDETEQKKTA